MQFTSGLLVLLLSATSFAIPVEKRTAAQVLTDLTAISNNVNAISAAALTYTGALTETFALATDVNTLVTSLTTATTDTTASTAFTNIQSASIISASTTLAPQIVTALSNLDAKASVFQAAGVSALVLADLQVLKTDSDALMVALAAKVNNPAAIQALQATIDAALDTAIATF